jgi:hypothetical protein
MYWLCLVVLADTAFLRLEATPNNPRDGSAKCSASRENFSQFMGYVRPPWNLRRISENSADFATFQHAGV